jgi:hypothetical protein
VEQQHFASMAGVRESMQGGGGSICAHGGRRVIARSGGSGICEHDRRKSRRAMRDKRYCMRANGGDR